MWPWWGTKAPGHLLFRRRGVDLLLFTRADEFLLGLVWKRLLRMLRPYWDGMHLRKTIRLSGNWNGHANG